MNEHAHNAADCEQCKQYKDEIERIKHYWAPTKIVRGDTCYFKADEVEVFLKAFVEMKAQLGRLPHGENKLDQPTATNQKREAQ